MNTQEFIFESKQTHGDKYDYSKSVYANAKTKITIICPKHGKFEQLRKNHKMGKVAANVRSNMLANGFTKVFDAGHQKLVAIF